MIIHKYEYTIGSNTGWGYDEKKFLVTKLALGITISKKRVR